MACFASEPRLEDGAATRPTANDDIPRNWRDDEKEDESGDTSGSGENESREYDSRKAEGLGGMQAENGSPGVFERIVSRVASRSSVDPGPPPDGGLVAWSQVLCGHLVIMNSWGFISSYGVFQTYYATLLAPLPPSDISWIGSFQIFLLFFIGTLTGRLTDAGFFRPVVASGFVLMTVGIFATSFCSQYWQFFLAQGVCVGLGNGLVFCPTIALLSTYFQRRRALAIGIAACGSATGGLIYPVMVRQLLPTVGFAWSVRAIGFVVLVTSCVSVTFMRTRISPRKSGRLVEWAAFKELEYTFYALGSFFIFLGLYFAFYYIASFSRTEVHPPLSYTDSLNLLLILNGVGAIGRLSFNFVADRVGIINLYIPCTLAVSIVMFCWPAVSSPGGMYAWAVVYGPSAGGIQSLFPAGLSTLTTDPRKQGTRLGMTFTIVSFAVLTGSPIAGAIITRCGGRYWGAQVYAGATQLVGLGFLIAARVVRKRRTGGRWSDKV